MDKSLFQTDWRLRNRLWEHLYKARLSYVHTFRVYRKSWNHEHCSFCFSSIGTQEDDLHSGYCTTDVEPSREEWICEKCYHDFHALFGWTVKNYPGLYGQILSHKMFDPQQEGKEFTRCVLCLTRISTDEDSLNTEYHLPGSDIWVCPACYCEYKTVYQWSE